LCSVCGSRDPQLHHIDEDPSNSVADNLIPLCPNCHLRDQHNPTKAIEIGRLRLFRKHKDPSILSPKFQPLFKRLNFLSHVNSAAESVDQLSDHCEELCRFIESLPQGSFYAGEIRTLTKKPLQMFMAHGEVYPPNSVQERISKYRAQLNNSRDRIIELLMELLRYQDWSYERV